MKQKQKMTVNQAKDTGLALTLICLLVAHFREDLAWVTPAIVFLVLTMIWPGLFRLPARAWFGFSHVMGTVVSKILLSIVFFVVASPMGLIRRMLGKDSMQTKAWRKGEGSVFRTRDHAFSAEDLERPY